MFKPKALSGRLTSITAMCLMILGSVGCYLDFELEANLLLCF